MKIIKVWANIDATGLFDYEGNIILQDETSITDSTWKELQEWVKEYEFIIPMPVKDRLSIQQKIIELDNNGINLLHKIEKEWNRDKNDNKSIRFKYYSEGLMKYLL